MTEPTASGFRFSHKQSLFLVFLCTLFGVAAQYFIKIGASSLSSNRLGDILTNPYLIGGYSLYGLSTVFLTLALRDGELSLLYPVISLTYVWVTILSVTVFHETMSAFKMMGIGLICTGVALLGEWPEAVTTPPQSIAYVLLASFLGSFGAVFLKAGAGRLHRDLRTLFFNWRLAFGVLMFLFSSYFFVLGLRQGELSVLYPMIALGYLWTIIWSRFFFGEPVTKRKVVGIAIILIGVVFLNLSNR